jgi:hypothetical protein
MTAKLKYQLPNIIELPYRFDIEKLRKELDNISNKFKGVLEANGTLCANNHKLVKEVYDHFEQINLTVFKDQPTEVSLDLCETTYNTNSAKRRLRRTDIDSSLDERNYNYPTEDFTGSYFEEVIKTFKCPAIRVRLTKLKPGKELVPHIDYDPSYATRIIVPIYTNENVINQFWRKNEYFEQHLPANGSAFFLNTGVKHSVVNNGDTDRVALMFSLDGTEDINDYIKNFDGNHTTIST